MPVKPTKHHHHHHPHSGATVDVDQWFETIEHHTHYHSAASQSALQTCLAALRGVDGMESREAVLGALLALLCQSGHLTGLMRPLGLAMTGIDHYNAPVKPR